MEKFSKNDHHVTTGMYNKEKLVKYSDLTYGDEYKMKKKQTFIIEVVDTQYLAGQGELGQRSEAADFQKCDGAAPPGRFCGR